MKIVPEIKDMMSYQLNSFQRSQVKSVEEVLEIENIETPTTSPPPTPTVTLAPMNLYSNCGPTGKGVKTPITPSAGCCWCNSSSQYFCADCERESKKARTIRFGSGGDVIIDKSKSYANFFAARAGSGSNSGSGDDQDIDDDSKCFTVSIKVPSTFDFNAIRNSRFNISISISEKSGRNKIIVPESDSEFIVFNRRLLAESGWYYAKMDWQDSIRMLKSSPVGTFLLRDSGDPRYLFSLSAQTEFGPISSRISYSNRKFRLDSSDRVSELMPTFSSILSLVEHYVKYGLVKNPAGRQVWVDSTGRPFSPVHLTKPKRNSVGSLQHLARLATNKVLPRLNPNSIPPRLNTYLQEYPFTI